jgi:hypothetical protein
MILRNTNEPFECEFNNKVYSVPKGDFEVEQALGNFIVRKGHRWGLIVTEVSNKLKPGVNAIRPVEKKEDVITASEVEPVVETKKAGRPSTK